MKNQLKRSRWLFTSLILLIAILPGSAAAQGSDPTDDDVNAIAKQLYCPVCENIPLDACGTTACEQWRGIIRDKLSEGWTEEQIKTYFVDQYGDRVLAEPPRRGFNWLVYIVPLVIFAGGGVLLYRGFQQWRTVKPENNSRKVSKPSAKSDKPMDEYINRVEEELRKRSKG
ncbi:MAG: cytochrome c-type biogenesis protein CcmH [Anaerolineales bacterium]|nr:cytochrome c-type biogenesis protein CcmH [Anaerolineales bacterium]